MYQIRNKNAGKEAVWIVPPKISIGSANDNALILKETGIQAHHAQLQIKNDKVYLLPIENAKDIWVNGNAFINAIELHVGDVIKLHNTELELLLPEHDNNTNELPRLDSNVDKWFLETLNGDNKGKRFKLKKSTVIGRLESCDIQLHDEKMSRQHARLDIIGGALKITDMGSANGCFINGNKVTSTYARPEDQLKVGESEFKIIGPFLDSEKTTISDSPVQQAKIRPVKNENALEKLNSVSVQKEQLLESAVVLNKTENKKPAFSSKWLLVTLVFLLAVGVFVYVMVF
jgi:pSer/pThr/pTyr-binding forkhead associated (FHA) protein